MLSVGESGPAWLAGDEQPFLATDDEVDVLSDDGLSNPEDLSEATVDSDDDDDDDSAGAAGSSPVSGRCPFCLGGDPAAPPPGGLPPGGRGSPGGSGELATAVSWRRAPRSTSLQPSSSTVLPAGGDVRRTVTGEVWWCPPGGGPVAAGSVTESKSWSRLLS